MRKSRFDLLLLGAGTFAVTVALCNVGSAVYAAMPFGEAARSAAISADTADDGQAADPQEEEAELDEAAQVDEGTVDPQDEADEQAPAAGEAEGEPENAPDAATEEEKAAEEEQPAEPAESEEGEGGKGFFANLGASSTSSNEGLSDRELYVATWAPRIDAFNAGYPLEGYGYAFAEAAYDYGVDPRFSPAIARVESSSGELCFAWHNAWGWGDAEWPDWDTAIRSHVAGLAAGYGYTLSWEAAEVYNGVYVEDWYNWVASCMYEIWPGDYL